ncbi:hypothetical protein HII28_08470 [Planctomonas sp. JC2975]|uniref:hypothetical protein n=1 Tax=Planctomonas sp. JC2975 TaxID=2729626 RepID=UPI001474A64D|nr:hypothetical protein [Planctomonas sp. JC2975]NNC11912.1 hypothetical protein [Planctomonas sp. JC2975]
MNTTVGVVISLLLPLVIMAIVTALVAGRVRNAPSTSAWKSTRDGVQFVVSLRRWQRVLMRVAGIIAIAVGLLLFLSALSGAGETSNLAMGIVGSLFVVVGVFMVWLAHGMARLRLEVTPDAVFAFPLAGAPRETAISDITELTSRRSSNYGGIVAKTAAEQSFSATRIMLGYPQLIDFLRERRPDLVIPDASWPLQTPARDGR